MAKIKIGTLNLKGRDDKGHLYILMKLKELDVMLIQETALRTIQ